MEYYECICIGIGEIGRPLYELLNGVYKTLPIDPIHYPANSEIQTNTSFLHVCLPGDLKGFDDLVLGYINKYKPLVVFIHSTVVPGTTDRLKANTNTTIVHTPVHGKHQNNQMKKDMLRYPKYVGSPTILDEETIEMISTHLNNMGFSDVRFLSNVCNTEWLKVLSTTFFGLQIFWAQEVERMCDKFNLNYDEVTDFFPIQEDVRGATYPGFCGGHCVSKNIEIIKSIHDSKLLDWMEWSNYKKRVRDSIQIDDKDRREDIYV